ncbi:MAG: hypothetical protein ACLR5T_06670 [Veillonella sp.]
MEDWTLADEEAIKELIAGISVIRFLVMRMRCMSNYTRYQAHVDDISA